MIMSHHSICLNIPCYLLSYSLSTPFCVAGNDSAMSFMLVLILKIALRRLIKLGRKVTLKSQYINWFQWNILQIYTVIGYATMNKFCLK